MSAFSCEHLREVCLADARWTEEKERTDRALGVSHKRAAAAKSTRNRLNRGSLADNDFAKRFLHAEKLLCRRSVHLLDWNAAHRRDGFGDIFFSRFDDLLGVGLLPLLERLLELCGRKLYRLAVTRRRIEVACLHSRVLLALQRVNRLLPGSERLGPCGRTHPEARTCLVHRVDRLVYFGAMPFKICIVSATVGSSTCTDWKRRSSAASFSMDLWYSLSVVAPTH